MPRSGSWRVVNMEIVRGRADLVGPLRDAVRRERLAVLSTVRARWRSVEVTSSRGGTARPDVSTELRARVAAATFAEYTPLGLRIGVRTQQVDPRYGNSLTWYLNASGRRPWRSPVFGNRRVWKVQRGQSVFFAAVRAYAPVFRSGAEQAMERVAREY